MNPFVASSCSANQHEIGRSPVLEPSMHRAVPLERLAPCGATVRRLRCFARLRWRVHSPARASHARIVSGLTHTPSAVFTSSASSVGPKPAYSGSLAMASTRSRVSGDSERFRPPTPEAVHDHAVALRLEPPKHAPEVTLRHPEAHRAAGPDSTPSLTCLNTEIQSQISPNIARKRTFLRAWYDTRAASRVDGTPFRREIPSSAPS